MYPVPVGAVLEVDLEVVGGHLRPRRVQLTGAVVAADARQVHVGDVGRSGAVGRRGGHGLVGVSVDGTVAHDGFEGVLGVGFQQLLDAGVEPVGSWGLRVGW